MTATRKIRLIKNGRVLDPANGRDAVSDIHIDERGRITQTAGRRLQARQIIDASGCWVLPGLIDLAARFRQPGQEHKADIASESRAALAGGVTGVCIPPDTSPPVDTPAVVDLITQKARACRAPRVYLIGAATVGLNGEQLSEMAALKGAGCVGIGNVEPALADNRMQRNIMDYAAGLGLRVFLPTQDAALSAQGCAHEGAVATRLGLPGIPAAAETIAIARDIALVEATGVRAHFCRLSTARGVELITEAKRRGLPVSADVAAHQLWLAEQDVLGFHPDLRLLPPLRAQADRDALRRGVAEGVIDAVCSDHQPHEADAKLAPFPMTQPGLSALETFLPLLLKLAREQIIPLQTLIAACTCNPAAIIGKPAGALGPGATADLTVLDPEQAWVFRRREMLSRGKNSPFDGWAFPAKVTHTLVGGAQCYPPS